MWLKYNYAVMCVYMCLRACSLVCMWATGAVSHCCDSPDWDAVSFLASPGRQAGRQGCVYSPTVPAVHPSVYLDTKNTKKPSKPFRTWGINTTSLSAPALHSSLSNTFNTCIFICIYIKVRTLWEVLCVSWGGSPGEHSGRLCISLIGLQWRPVSCPNNPEWYHQNIRQ